MGLWIKADGSVKDIAPQNGKDYKWHELKKYVNGYIEIVRLGDGKIIVCNEEGKLCGLPLNRAIRAEDSNEIVDIIAGPFFVCDCSGESFGSLSKEQQERYLKKYRNPERFFRVGDSIEAVPMILGRKGKVR